jgi:FAD/FMN-containing dehydrogenase/SAM-dependent methyltransferase
MNRSERMGIVVNDVTRLNPVPVLAVATPTTTEEIREAILRTELPISVGGGHFSMGGQTASPGSLHLDMRRFNGVLHFDPSACTIRVQSGIRWCDIQRFIDPHGLALQIMQTYANFTVGGSLSVNVHGRYIGLGPLILSVRSLRMMLANGQAMEASPAYNPEIFHAVIGGYGGLGLILEVELALTENVRVRREDACMPALDYPAYFRSRVRDSGDSIFHNADLYPPDFRHARAVTWRRTERAVTTSQRLQKPRRQYPLQRYYMWVFTETRSGRWRRRRLLDPLLYLGRPVHWRNYEAVYDVGELEPGSRHDRTYVLQEYFVPVERFEDFRARLSEILQRHRVNMVNVSVRHAHRDPGSLLAWARDEVFAFVLYHKQRTRTNARERVAVWTRELIDAALACGGTYYLPYQPHATIEQFHQAYPRAQELFALKRTLDPDYRWRNVLWDKYYAPELEPSVTTTAAAGSDFHAVYDTVRGNDDFYRFLQNVYRIFPEDRFHALIQHATGEHCDDEAIYRAVQAGLPSIKSFLSELVYALPALARQKQEMTRQTLALLGERRRFDGYLEVGSTGRYLSQLRKHLRLEGDRVLLHDVAAGFSPVDIVERGGLRRHARFVPLDDYAPIPADAVADGSIELLTCHIGLHHARLDRLEPFIASLRRVLKPDGVLILRDHDVSDDYMRAMASLAHAVFNAGLNLPWQDNARELRHFRPIDEWVALLGRYGLVATGPRLLQAQDPTLNTLLRFDAA